MHRAGLLLETTDLSIGAILRKAGLGDQSPLSGASSPFVGNHRFKFRAALRAGRYGSKNELGWVKIDGKLPSDFDSITQYLRGK